MLVYRYVLAAALVVAAVAAFVTFRAQPSVRRGATVTHWRTEGDEVERCTTCHDGPHAGAPELVAIHPIASYGCVSCHGGRASAPDATAAHEGLFATAESGCGRCHASEKRLVTHEGKNLAPRLEHGRAIWSERCAACHDAGASHDVALPVRWISTASNPSEAMRAIVSPPPGMPKLVASDDEAKDLVAWLWSFGESDTVRGYANVPGATAEEGAELFAAIGCTSCHAKGRADFPRARSEDFLAFYMENPRRVRMGAAMPSLRLTRREAAGLAKLLAAGAAPAKEDAAAIAAAAPAYREPRTKCAAANDVELTHAECGAKLAAKLGCGSCHVDAGPASKAPDLSDWGTRGSSKDAATSFAPPKHPDTGVAPSDAQDVAIALAAKMPSHVVPRFDPTHAAYFTNVRGDELLAERGCTKCHDRASRTATKVGDADAPRARVPPLKGEGAKVQPEWLLSFLRDPEAAGVRPVLHPEWVWPELVPADKRAVRMPSYALANDDATAIVRALAQEDGGDYPYANVTAHALSSSDVVTAAILLNAQCMQCHFVGALPIDRAKVDLEKLAPDLGRVATRLRPAFVSQLLARPSDFVEGMPAVWKDPAGPALPLSTSPDVAPKKTAAEQIAVVSTFLYLVRDDTRLPRPGDETRVPILGLGQGVSP